MDCSSVKEHDDFLVGRQWRILVTDLRRGTQGATGQVTPGSALAARIRALKARLAALEAQQVEQLMLRIAAAVGARAFDRQLWQHQVIGTSGVHPVRKAPILRLGIAGG